MEIQEKTTPAIKLPPCLHPETLRVLKRIRRPLYPCTFSEGERAIARRRPPILVSKWAEQHRIIHTSSRPGRWRNDVTRYTQDLMDASFCEGVRTIILMKSPQTGGTECIHNCIGYSLDRRPGPVLYVYPDEITARENARDRIIPMIKDSPRLVSFLSGNPDDLSGLRIGLIHTTIHMAWSGSPSRLGNKPIRYLVLDELDKYQDTGKEARSEALAEKRVTTWGDKARIWKISTPTTAEGPINHAWQTAEARFRFSVPCPHCGTHQVMYFEFLEWPRTLSWQEVFSQKAGRYKCPTCGTLWSDADRDRAVRDGHWVDEQSGLELFQYIVKHKPASIAFHVPAIISPFVSLSEICSRLSEYETSQDAALLKDIQNNYKGEPWEAEFEKREEGAILALCDDRPRGTVPGPLPSEKEGGKPTERVAALLAGVDTQYRYFRYVIRAFGYGESPESWLVQEGIAQNFETLEDILFNAEYPDVTGRKHKVRFAIIDAMGEQRRTAQVYSWAAKNRGRVFASQGVHSPSSPVSFTSLEYFPGIKGERVKIPGGLLLYKVDTTMFKSILANRLAVNPADPGAFHLHAQENGNLATYAREMVAEVWNPEKAIWDNPHGRGNHAWDCEYLMQALAYIVNLSRMQRPDAVEQQQTQSPRPVRHQSPPRPFQQRGYRGIGSRLAGLSRR